MLCSFCQFVSLVINWPLYSLSITPTNMKNIVFLIVMPCSLVGMNVNLQPLKRKIKNSLLNCRNAICGSEHVYRAPVGKIFRKTNLNKLPSFSLSPDEPAIPSEVNKVIQHNVSYIL
jgi:hypothetical protein